MEINKKPGCLMTDLAWFKNSVNKDFNISDLQFRCLWVFDLERFIIIKWKGIMWHTLVQENYIRTFINAQDEYYTWTICRMTNWGPITF